MLSRENLKKRTQISQESMFFDDRADEVASFFQISRDEAIAKYREYNVEFKTKPRSDLFSAQDYESVLSSYLNKEFFEQSVTRLMMHYDRLGLAWKIIEVITRLAGGVRGKRVLDYGCGAADYSLACAINGASPIIADIEGGPVEFAKHRFDLREIDVEVVRIGPKDMSPDLPVCDIIFAAEVLEHVVNPPQLISAFSAVLPVGGVLAISDYPMKPKSVGGAHLVSASLLREECLFVVERRFELIWQDPRIGYVFRKK